MPDSGLLEAAFDAVSWQVAILDADGTILRVNQAWEAFGRENAAPGGAPVAGAGSDYLGVCRASPEDEGFSGRQAAEGIEAVLAGEREEFRMEYPCHAPGRRRWFLMSVRPLDGPEGGAVVTHVEITERKSAEDRLAYQALHDPLTDLPNRRLFVDRLRQALAREGRQEGRTAVAYLDLDGFKRINDAHGHEVGDEALRLVARALDAAVREGDTAARLGGDEFAILLADVADRAAAEEAVGRVVDGIAAIDRVGDRAVDVEASAGVALAPDGGTDPDELVRRADRAMYGAKERGARIALAGDHDLEAAG